MARMPQADPPRAHERLSIPRGWFQVAWSSDLAPGDVRALRFFGRDLVLYRATEDAGAAVHLMDAHCPHLGAHLGHGGSVVGDSLRCPFHAWRFGGDGQCLEVPYAKRIPPRAELRAWPVCERNRLIFAYFDPGAEAPSFQVPEIDDLEDFGGFDRYEWTIETHVQEIGENAVDRAHFRYVHGTTEIPESELTLEGPIRRALQRVSYDTPRGPVPGEIRVEAHGMGFSITRFSGLCDTLLLISHTPIDEKKVRAHFSFCQRAADQEGPRARVAAAVIREIVRQMEQDIPIWETKRYLERPLLCDGDGPIGAYRRWTRQFYADT